MHQVSSRHTGTDLSIYLLLFVFGVGSKELIDGWLGCHYGASTLAEAEQAHVC